MQAMRHLMRRLGLTVNETKTKLVTIPEERITFLGYEIGLFYGKGGKPYVGHAALKEVHQARAQGDP